MCGLEVVDRRVRGGGQRRGKGLCPRLYNERHRDLEAEKEPGPEPTDDDGARLSEIAKDITSKLHDSGDEHATKRIGEDGGPNNSIEAICRVVSKSRIVSWAARARS